MQEGWPAAEWTSRELLEKCGDCEVPVEVSSGGGDYRDAYDDAKSQPGRTFDAGVPVPLSLLLNAMQLTLEQEPDQANSQLKLYLAQRDVAEVLPELAANIPEAPPFPGLAERLHQRSVWLGCAGTLTPLHHDPYHNLFCQVWGSKTVRLYSPQQSQSLYPFPNPFLRNTSQVDVLSPDLDRHPMFASALYLECTLRPGEMLYIPKKWWHCVWARTASLSISYWWTAVC
ncbi:g9967 [Coccomyxa elongata]